MEKAEVEDDVKKSKIVRMAEILKSHDIEMEVYGCGCCGSPLVMFKYKGETILDEDEVNLSTMDISN